MSRPQKISYELIEAICEDIARGFAYDQAAQRNEISASTFFRWIQRGKIQDCEEIYKVFVKDVERASDFSEAEALQQIRSAAIVNRNWKAAAWFLERRFPNKYGKQASDHIPSIEDEEGPGGNS